tara:strand:+ start:273 stop:1373 length:1101 start_codon:yes stop_codon:yes gene_type:complete
MGIIIPLFLIILTSIIIWKSSDGFDIASSYLGRNLSNGVKGATINAISSSMPELLTTIFFLIFLKDAEGFSGGIGTVAGSAVFNAMVIPAFSVIVVYYYKIATSIKVSKNVIYRDSISLLIAQATLILIIYFEMLNWLGGLILVLLYSFYVFYMFLKMEKNKPTTYVQENHDSDKNRFILFLKLDFYGAIIGNKKIDKLNSIILLIISLFFIGVSCLTLVMACELIGEEEYSFLGLHNLNGLNLPISIVAVIIAAAATSVPDTILSVKDAKKGNYNDAISNALGSNIFDICFALGLPILLYTIFNGPILIDSSTLTFSLNILIILFLLTIITFLIFIYGESIGISKAIMLLLMYVVFIVYIISTLT